MEDAASEQERHRLRRARHEVARRHHPDVGGDPEVFVTQMHSVDRRLGPDDTPTADPDAVAIARRLRRAAAGGKRKLRRGTRALRGRLPRHCPGSRRYVDL